MSLSIRHLFATLLAPLVLGATLLAHAQGSLDAPTPAPAQAPASAAVGQVAGHVAFVHGGATRQTGQGGAAQPLTTGQPVYVGDRIQTAAGAYVHLRMIDQAFVALRPQSQLAIHTYDYAAPQPQASRIRLDLQQGRSRVVSGKGGQAAKQNYRFNTPIAAIGLRGTDYTVEATATATRVAVAQGVVVVSPFLDGCLAEQLGPCNTRWARDLKAGIPHAYLEVTATDPQPKLVQPPADKSKPGTDPAKDPAKDSATAPHAQDSAAPAVEATTRATSLLAQAQGSAVDPGSASGNAPPSAPPPPPLPRYPQPPSDGAATPGATPLVAQWGRWSSIVAQQPDGSPSIASAFGGSDYTVLATNDAFALFMPRNTSTLLPTQGQASFTLKAGEAYLSQSGSLSPATVTQGQLDVNFAQRSYTTQVQVGLGAASPESIRSAGAITAYGQLKPDAAQSNATIAGWVINHGNEAAYLFDKSLANGGRLLGATQWGR